MLMLSLIIIVDMLILVESEEIQFLGQIYASIKLLNIY